MSNIETLGALVHIELEDTSTTAGGLILAGGAGQFGIATVLSDGRGRLDEKGNLVASLVKKGERVVINKAQVHDIKVGGLDLKLVNESAILVVIKEPEVELSQRLAIKEV